MNEKNETYWSFNVPLQVWPKRQDPNNGMSPIVGSRVLNYMPRHEECIDCDLDDLLGDQTREEFFERAARVLENLAQQMRKAGKNKEAVVYYPGDGMLQPDILQVSTE